MEPDDPPQGTIPRGEAFFDPELIQVAEQSGKSVKVSESSTQTVNINAIPAVP